MQICDLHITQEVRHPEFDGIGEVKELTTSTAVILFNTGKATLTTEEVAKLILADPHFEPTKSLKQFILETAELAAQRATSLVQENVQLGTKWIGGILLLKPKDPELLPKEVEIDVLFHKIVMTRDNLRVLEQKINAHPNLNDKERIELQQYITKSYGSLTTFNVLFKEKQDQF